MFWEDVQLCREGVGLVWEDVKLLGEDVMLTEKDCRLGGEDIRIPEHDTMFFIEGHVNIKLINTLLTLKGRDGKPGNVSVGWILNC